MTNKQKTDNQLIAEFMKDKKALDVYRHPKYLESDDQQYVKYHKSYDWLMPVVQKIGTYLLVHNEEVKKVIHCKVIVMHSVLYQRVVNFIKFINSQPK